MCICSGISLKKCFDLCKKQMVKCSKSNLNKERNNIFLFLLFRPAYTVIQKIGVSKIFKYFGRKNYAKAAFILNLYQNTLKRYIVKYYYNIIAVFYFNIL